MKQIPHKKGEHKNKSKIEEKSVKEKELFFYLLINITMSNMDLKHKFSELWAWKGLCILLWDGQIYSVWNYASHWTNAIRLHRLSFPVTTNVHSQFNSLSLNLNSMKQMKTMWFSIKSESSNSVRGCSVVGV